MLLLSGGAFLVKMRNNFPASFPIAELNNAEIIILIPFLPAAYILQLKKTEDAPANILLLCNQTNQTVDELAFRISNHNLVKYQIIPITA